MLRLACRTIGLAALGMTVACHTSSRHLITGDATVTPGAHATDALWMIALPPVTVRARRSEPAPTDTVAKAAHTQGRRESQPTIDTPNAEPRVRHSGVGRPCSLSGLPTA
jgi:hypothetical protein